MFLEIILAIVFTIYNAAGGAIAFGASGADAVAIILVFGCISVLVHIIILLNFLSFKSILQEGKTGDSSYIL